MAVTKPYFRTCRQFTDGRYGYSGHSRYILHPQYADDPRHYIRGFLLLLEDLQRLFEYIEPADKNLQTYSYRIHALLLRSCIEAEVNFKAILRTNGYSKKDDWDITDYFLIEKSHRLSEYQVKLPTWTGVKGVRSPFSSWQTKPTLEWYRAYNLSKHDRHQNFEKASLENAIDAVTGVLVLLSSQFYTWDFSPTDSYITDEGENDGFESGIGGYFRVSFPTDWTEEELYDFDWQSASKETEPFQKFPYDSLKDLKRA